MLESQTAAAVVADRTERLSESAVHRIRDDARPAAAADVSATLALQSFRW